MARSATMKILCMFLMCFGIRIQSPVRRVKRGRSLKYSLICKALSSSGKKGRRSTKKFKSARPKYKRKPGR